MRIRSMAGGIDTMTRAQLADMKAAHNWLAQLVRQYPELADEHTFAGLLKLVGDDGSMAKVVNDLRHLAREGYEADPLPVDPNSPYCERQKRPVAVDWWDLHKKECFVCSGAPEGRHGTRYVTEYAQQRDGSVLVTERSDPPAVTSFRPGVDPWPAS